MVANATIHRTQTRGPGRMSSIHPEGHEELSHQFNVLSAALRSSLLYK